MGSKRIVIQELIEIFRKPSVEVMAQRQLEDARRSLLSAQEHMEYAASLVQFHEARIRRLSEMLHPTKNKPAEKQRKDL